MQVKRIDSSDENVSKYVFDFGNAVAEAVLYKYPTYEERTVICCSTQSGCPVGCRFCGAGDAFVRSLTGDEIVAQVQHLFADRGINPDDVRRCQITGLHGPLGTGRGNPGWSLTPPAASPAPDGFCGWAFSGLPGGAHSAGMYCAFAIH